MKVFSVIMLSVGLLILSSIAFAKVIVIFDENSATEASAGKFAEGFISHDAGSVVEVVTNEKFAGKSSIFCTPSQSYNPNMPGWGFPIDETPYMTFAWKKDGGTGIMIQLAYNATWAYRYFSGVNVTNWPGIQLEEEIPKTWKMYTRDLTKDFAAGWNLTGMALTPWDGNAGYYDFIILHSDPNPPMTAVFAKNKVIKTWALIKNQ